MPSIQSISSTSSTEPPDNGGRRECGICGEPYYPDSALGEYVPSCNCSAMTAEDDHPDSADEESDDVPVERSFEDDGLDTAPVL